MVFLASYNGPGLKSHHESYGFFPIGKNRYKLTNYIFNYFSTYCKNTIMVPHVVSNIITGL